MRSTPGIFKTVLIALAGGLTLAVPVEGRVLSIPFLFFPLAFLLPILMIALNPIGRRYFEPPGWSQSPILNRNRLVAAQFAAVFFLVVAACLALNALIQKAPLSALAMLAVAFGGGYAVSIPLALRWKRRDEQ